MQAGIYITWRRLDRECTDHPLTQTYPKQSAAGKRDIGNKVVGYRSWRSECTGGIGWGFVLICIKGICMRLFSLHEGRHLNTSHLTGAGIRRDSGECITYATKNSKYQN